MQQQNKVLQHQLMLLSEKQMKSNQLAGIYNQPSTGVGKKLISSNVNVSKPGSQKEALQMLNSMMNKRVTDKKST